MAYNKTIDTVELETTLLWYLMCNNLGYQIPIASPPLPYFNTNGVKNANQIPTACPADADRKVEH